MDDELFLTQQPFKFYIKKLEKKEESDFTKHKGWLIFIKGFPFDEGALLCNERGGADRGPSVFRYALETSPFYPFEKIENLAIYDDGDVHSSSLTKESIPLSKAHEKLQGESKDLLLLQNSVIFVIGGSNDASCASSIALFDAFPESKIGFISIDPSFDVFSKLEEKITCKSASKYILEDERFQKNKCKMIFFGTQGSQASKNHYDFVRQKDTEVFWLEKNIRRYPTESSSHLKTQAGQLMEKIITKLANEVDFISVSIDLGVINSNSCQGLSSPSTVGGLSSHEMIEITELVGRSKIVKSLNITEFNPAVESKKTSHLIAEMFYHFCKGVSERQ